MKTFICEICGDAYLGSEAPSKCPFCGADKNFIKNGFEADPVFRREGEIGKKSKGSLIKTLNLEMEAQAIYLCMASHADSYEINKMYKRLAKVELEHATIVSKLLDIDLPESPEKKCGHEDIENFKKTIYLEEKATALYKKFATEAKEQKVKIFFTALTNVEAEHIDLIKEYM